MQASQVTIISPRTAAVAAAAGKFGTSHCDTCLVYASNLTAAETVTVSIAAPDGTYVPVTNAAGAAVVLTPAIPSVALEGGPIYSFVKTVTAGASGLYAVCRRTGAK